MLAVTACRDLSGFSTTDGDRYQGAVVNAGFVLAGMDKDTQACVTLDTDHLQDQPGTIATSDGMFPHVALRPIPQIWHDPLSTLTFGEGRLKNLVYVAKSADGDVFVVISLMQSGDVEVRLLRGAPGISPDGSANGASGGNLFAVFSLSREQGPCSF